MALASLAPLSNYVHFLIVLIIADAVTAIYNQYKDAKKEINRYRKNRHLTSREQFFLFFGIIESSKLSKTVEKLFGYILGIILCFYFDKIVFQITPIPDMGLNHFSIANFSVVLISSVELTSVLSNLGKITNNPVYYRIIALIKKKAEETTGENQ